MNNILKERREMLKGFEGQECKVNYCGVEHKAIVLHIHKYRAKVKMDDGREIWRTYDKIMVDENEGL